MSSKGVRATVAIRPACLADAPGIARVHVETWRAAYAGLIGDRYLVGLDDGRQALRWRREIQASSPTNDVLVAEMKKDGGEEIVGFGSFGRRRSASLPYDGEVYTLYVSVDWQGFGVGHRLLGGLFHSLVKVGCDSAFLWVLSENPARFFYESQAGRPVAWRRESFAGALLDETAYAWPDLTGWLAAQTQTTDRPPGPF